MDSNEQLVREKWERVGNSPKPEPLYFVWSYGWSCSDDNEAGAWQAAADFTRAHEKKISDVEEEISVLRETEMILGHNFKQHAKFALKRILAARQAALDALRKGWRG